MQQRRAADREQPLHGLALVGFNAQAQPLVARFQQLPAGLQGGGIELAAQAQDQRHMIGRLPRFQLLQEPEPLLRKGERRGGAASRRLGTGADGLWRAAGALVYAVAVWGPNRRRP